MPMPDDELPDLAWRKAARSISNGACVEVGAGPRIVAVRDSTDRSGPQLAYSTAAWRTFAQSVRGGRHDLQF